MQFGIKFCSNIWTALPTSHVCRCSRNQLNMTAKPTAGYLCVKWQLASCRTSDIVRSQNRAWYCEHQAIPIYDIIHNTAMLSLPCPCSWSYYTPSWCAVMPKHLPVCCDCYNAQGTVTAFLCLCKLWCCERACTSKPAYPSSALTQYEFRVKIWSLLLPICTTLKVLIISETNSKFATKLIQH